MEPIAYMGGKIEKGGSEYINSLGKRYYEILQETGRGTVKFSKKRWKLEFDDRTDEQVNIANIIALRMQPGIYRIAKDLKFFGYHRLTPTITVGLYGSEPPHDITVEMLAQEGTMAVIEKLGLYDPSKGYIQPFAKIRAASSMQSLILSYTPDGYKKLNKRRRQRKKKDDDNGMASSNRSLNSNYIGNSFTGELDDIVDENSLDIPISNLQRDSVNSALSKSIGNLNKREQMVIRHRFGVEGADERTLDDLACFLGVTKQRISQIQFSAIEKLRRELTRQGRREEYL